MFYIERDNILNEPDEDLNDYCRRILPGNAESHLIEPDLAPSLEEEGIVSNGVSCCDKSTTPLREVIVSTTAQSPTSQLSALVTNVEEVHDSDTRYHSRALSRARCSDCVWKQ